MARGRGRPRKQANDDWGNGPGGEPEERPVLANSAARAATIRNACRWLSEQEAERKTLSAGIAEYKQIHIKGGLGMKLKVFNVAFERYKIEEQADRDAFDDTLRECFAALGDGEQLDWLRAAEQKDASA